MNSRQVIANAVCFILTGVATAFASGEPQESFLYQNFVRASEVLDRAIAAHGGVELIDRSADFRVSFTGTLRYEGHYPRPRAYRDYRFEGGTIHSAGLHALKSEGTLHYEGDEPMATLTLVGPANGLWLDFGARRPDSIATRDLEKSRRREMEFLPQEYLRQARDRSASLRLLSSAEGYDVLAYSLDDGESRALFIASDTHLLMRVERIGHWTIKGDRLEWRTFSNYADRSGLKVPMHSETHVEEFSTQYTLMSDIATIEIGAAVDADEFAIPPAFRAGLETWKLEERPAEDPLALLPYHDLGKGAYVIDLPPSDSRALLVEFSNFAVVVEAGDRSELGVRLLATADHILPDKPVRYVAMTHHHPLYACGLRPYVQRGVTVLATAGDIEYYRDLVTRPHRIHPDEQQRNPREPKFELIDKTRVIKDKKQRLELYQFDYSTHTDEYVLPYLPSHKLIVTGDMVYILRDMETRPANVREQAIYRLVKERKLDVRNIMQTWFLTRSDYEAPFSTLQEKIRLAETKDTKH